jgi:hypothetical protein
MGIENENGAICLPVIFPAEDQREVPRRPTAERRSINLVVVESMMKEASAVRSILQGLTIISRAVKVFSKSVRFHTVFICPKMVILASVSLGHPLVEVACLFLDRPLY